MMMQFPFMMGGPAFGGAGGGFFAANKCSKVRAARQPKTQHQAGKGPTRQVAQQ